MSDNEFKDPYVESYKKWAKDQAEYNEMMKNKVLVPEGKNFKANEVYVDGTTMHVDMTVAVPKCPDFIHVQVKLPKCNCGTAKTYKNPSLRMHSTWCELRKNDC